MHHLVYRFARDESGATAIEYAMIGILVSVMVVAGATIIGSKLGGIFQYIADQLTKTRLGARTRRGSGLPDPEPPRHQEMALARCRHCMWACNHWLGWGR